MTRPIVVLRPEPGNSATAARARARGLSVVQLPMFEVAPIAWQPPDPTDHDALLMTSANAARAGGAGLAALRHLPVLAVGKATAATARDGGLDVTLTGDSDAAAVVEVARGQGFSRLLHLRGADTNVAAGGIITGSIAVYDSIARAIDAADVSALCGAVALLHSPRAARHFAHIIGAGRASIRIAALSDAVRQAAGDGWGGARVAAMPTDAALLDTACLLID